MPAVVDNTNSAPDPERGFRTLLHRALTEGLPLPPEARFGPRTRAAVARLARDYPDASTELINDAFDAFDGEHRQNDYPYPRPRPPTAPPPAPTESSPHRAPLPPTGRQTS